MTEPVYKNGFSFVELIIVLFLLTVFILLPAVYVPAALSKAEGRAFVQQFEADLYYAEQLARTHEQRVVLPLPLHPSAQSYSIIAADGAGLQRDIPSQVRFYEGSMLGSRIAFSSSGNIHNPGSFYIETAEGFYEVMIYLGKGRVRIEQQ
ncbi:competence type IV pilus minor pilin ComGD [Salsuginibacillus halophilus]|nr:competence type IV pilus minor pilin ComGD [Salsuginibacillus halophilus]